MVIYKIINKINGKIYIGQSQRNNPNYLGSGSYLIKAIKKYGRKSFQKEVIAWSDTKDKSNFLERFYIQIFNTKTPNGYNLTDGGEGGDTFLNNPNKEIIREKLKLKLSGDKNPMFGKNRPDVSKRNKENNPSKRDDVKEKARIRFLENCPMKNPIIAKKSGDSKRGRKNPKVSERNKLRNPMKLNEIALKVREKLKGVKRPYLMGDKNPAKRPEVKEKISKSNIGKKRPDVTERWEQYRNGK